MSGTSALLSISEWEVGRAEALMEECDRMEAELGAWLTRRSAQLSRRGPLPGRRFGGACSLHPLLWGTLIQIWATSPTARAKYSSEARAGLISATSSMDAEALMSLVGGLVEGAYSAAGGPAAA